MLTEYASVDPDKIQVIKDMNPPSNVSDVRRFLGIVNQLSKFSGRLALLTEQLGELLKKKKRMELGTFTRISVPRY